MADGIDNEEKYSQTQKEMWKWRDKYLDTFGHERRRAMVVTLTAVAAGVAGVAVGYVAGVLRVGR